MFRDQSALKNLIYTFPNEKRQQQQQPQKINVKEGQRFKWSEKKVRRQRYGEKHLSKMLVSEYNWELHSEGQSKRITFNLRLTRMKIECTKKWKIT